MHTNPLMCMRSQMRVSMRLRAWIANTQEIGLDSAQKGKYACMMS